MKKCFPNLLPAQEYLLPSNSKIDSETKKRYYKFLSSHIDNFKICDNDDEMSPYVATAVTWLISKTRDVNKFPLIAEENANFGFSYNLLGLKPLGVTLSIFGIVITLILTVLCLENIISIKIDGILVSLVVHLIFLVLWIFVITKELVISSGCKYARALLSVCDSNAID